MESFLFAVGSALWLGILTSISPCPLATNIAAISFIGKRVGSHTKVLIAGLLYTLGRTLAYLLVAMLVIKGLMSVFTVSQFLQQQIIKTLGPLLIIVGVLLIDAIPWPWTSRGSLSEKLQTRVEKLGLFGALLLGAVFALAFCPVSAALFFGSLIPLAVSQQSLIALPVLYGVGTALPVIGFSIILAFAAGRLSRAFNILTHVEIWMRRATAAVFICIGLYYTLTVTAG